MIMNCICVANTWYMWFIAVFFMMIILFSMVMMIYKLCNRRRGKESSLLSTPESSIIGVNEASSSEEEELEYRPVDGDPDVWFSVGGVVNEPVVEGVLAVWDLTAVAPGAYRLRLTVVYPDGNIAPWDEIEVRR